MKGARKLLELLEVAGLELDDTVADEELALLELDATMALLEDTVVLEALTELDWATRLLEDAVVLEVLTELDCATRLLLDPGVAELAAAMELAATLLERGSTALDSADPDEGCAPEEVATVLEATAEEALASLELPGPVDLSPQPARSASAARVVVRAMATCLMEWPPMVGGNIGMVMRGE